MDNFYAIIALLTAGIALAMGAVNLFTGLHKDGDKTDLIFGVVCVCLLVFFLIPPVGFIVEDKAPYPLNIVIKRIFSFSYYAIFPWFVSSYTGYKNKTGPFLAIAVTVAGYISMLLTPMDSDKPLWLMLAVLAIGIIVVHGLIGAFKLLKTSGKTKGWWFLLCMVIFASLFVLGAVNQLGNNYFGKMLGSKIFFPVNIFPLFFMLIMGVRLRNNNFEKFRLEKILRIRDSNWQSLLENTHLIIIKMDRAGNLTYINRYGIHALGYESEQDLLERNWFDHFLPVHEVNTIKAVFLKAMQNDLIVPHFKNAILTKDRRELIVNWTNVFTYDDQGALQGIMTIGSDITDQEKANRQIEQLKTELEKENIILKGEAFPEWMKQEIIGQSQAITYAIQKAKQVAFTNATVLLEGETGVGKELFADLVYRLSLRSEKPFVKINCGALPADLIEDELFGHEKGAFTGAIQSRKGRFEMADGGTIFLDEIGELPLALQPKLLRVLHNGEFQRVGGQQTIKVDVRIIAATNRDLEIEVSKARFREDLFYRLNVFPITIPSLRSRKEDIPHLIKFYVDKQARKHNKDLQNISKADIQRLCEYGWPGNVRELANVIERSVISSEGSTLKLDWFYHGIGNGNGNGNGGNHSLKVSSLEEVEKEHISRILDECNWKINGENGAAEKLNMHPNTLRSRMKKLNIFRAVKNPG